MKKTKDLLVKTSKLILVFGIIFSQLSFPLSVLADEISNSTEQNEMTNQDEDNNTSGETTEGQNDINLIGEDIPVDPNFDVELVENETNNLYIIKNKLDTFLTIKELKDSNSNITNISNEENTEITDETEKVKSGYKATITDESLQSKTYTIVILGDYDNDNMVTENDKEVLLELLKNSLEKDFDNSTLEDVIVDLNKDEIFDILDVTYPIFSKDTWENDKVATDELENYLMSSKEELYLDEEIEVNYTIEGFEIDSLVGIQGKLIYDDTLLELTKIEVDNVEQDIENLVDNNFIYLLENYNKNETLITLTFKALKVGAPVVSIENIVASLGGTKANIDVDKVTTSFNILEYGKGGDEELDDEFNTEEKEENIEEIIVVEPVKPVLLSSNNDIEKLIIEGYEIDFNSNKYEYSIKVKNDVNALNISVLLSSNKSIYYVEGNENFKDGENLVYVVVKAENGSTKTYTIKVEKEKLEKVTAEKENKKEKESEKEEPEEKNTSKTIIIILIVLVIIGLIYVIFKDDEEEKKEPKKEVKKEIKKETTKTTTKQEPKKTTKKGSKK